ncbi:hypothetical protein B9G53_12015 [Pseudanabaena sp. SR411]|uniref:hypothetical protein n=1 Tax=Pseudanabaena sp. SR411 TaxID=1980935 RepID=UPI000B97EC1D|nr:hypothetical protein [Pseudanabaena sp. SR411]OYQ64423.1 hypothetical protein B9G53_12015 [Pseudanabaena sp. SR411]
MSTVRFNSISQAVEGFKKTHSIFALGSIFQCLRIGMFRWEVENILGEPNEKPQPIANNSNFYIVTDLNTESNIYLVMSFDGKDNARMETDRLLSFVLFPINE